MVPAPTFTVVGKPTVGDFTEHNVNLFRVHLRKRELSENTIASVSAALVS